jgi:hypothetical protein
VRACEYVATLLQWLDELKESTGTEDKLAYLLHVVPVCPAHVHI